MLRFRCFHLYIIKENYINMDIITLPNPDTLPKDERGDWVCYYKGGSKHAKDFHELLKKSGIISFGASNYTNPRKVYYVTKFGGVFSMDKKEFNDIKGGHLSLSRFISDNIIGKSMEDVIGNSYELKF